MKIYSKPPLECTEKELNDFESLVTKGGEVTTNGLSERIKKAKELIFAYDGKIVGIVAIKYPSDSYKKRVFKKAGVSDQATNFLLEFGWLYASVKGKGVGSKLMKYFVESLKDTSCFATTRVNNDVMHHLMKKHSFIKQGNKYASVEGDYSLILYTKSHNN